MLNLNLKKRKKSLLNRTVSTLAWLSLIAAFVFGKFIKQEDYATILENLYESNPVEIIQSDREVLKVISQDFPRSSFVRYGKAQGYGGDLIVGLQYDSTGVIERVHLLKDRETVSFISKLKNNKYFKQYSGKKVNDPLVAKNDVDVVSGCTISSVAYANAVRQAGYVAAQTEFNLRVEEPVLNWVFGLNEFMVLSLIIVAILALYLKKKWLRYISLALSVVIVGFHLNASISITHFGRLLLGFLPNLEQHLIWWIFVGVSLGFPFFLKKNLYCYALCPFHAVEIVLIKISGFRLKLTKSFQKASKTVSLSLLWIAFMIIFLAENPTLGSYEPFALLFSLDGAGLQWYFLPAALIGAMLVPDFYCRYFCPVGRSFKLVLKTGNKMREILFRTKTKTITVKEIKPLKRIKRIAS